jgi:hypothetical protein
MAAMHLRTKAGLRESSLVELRQFIAEGKLNPTLKVVSLDGGQTFISAEKALAVKSDEDTFVEEPIAGAIAVSKKVQMRRVFLIIAAGVIMLCFFLPEFYAKDEPSGGVRWGWDTAWGILLFLVGLAALAGAIADLVLLNRIREAREYLKWVHLGTFSTAAFFSFMGMFLHLVGAGYHTGRGIPIMILAVLGCAVWALVVTVMIITQEKSAEE